MAADWIMRYNQNNSDAITELVNFVLKCTGCDSEVDVHDIEDPDNVTSKLTDLQEEYKKQYEAKGMANYPLISSAKSSSFSRGTLTGFFTALITNAHASEVLYNDLALIEHIQVWITTMSSCAIRPFRHTATMISLTISNAICDLVKEIITAVAANMKQLEGEKKKRAKNKERIAKFEGTIRENEKKRELAEGWLKDIFDTVFAHRYRDVDPRIRADCANALGSWILTCPDIFFEGQYLRYLGWVLSDTASQTRAEVIKQLLKLYKNKENAGRLRAFTDRFRPRMVEMATQDAEPAIRASAVELLDLVRELGMLEPDDIDTIGKLIFDAEPRVRKAITGFFAKNVQDLLESTLDELSGADGLDEVLGEEVEDDYESPRKAWLKLKCVAEVLESYDSENEDQDLVKGDADALVATGVESRYSMAAEAMCMGIEEAKNWEVLAGYLLYDHSSAEQTEDDIQKTFRGRCQLNEKEERLLLELLNAAVKVRLLEVNNMESDKKKKATKEEARQMQETIAIRLARVIPQLLSKFGANPATASAVLRLEHLLNLKTLQELQQDSKEYELLLDNINKQFLTHADQNVLAEAKTALLHARSYEDLEEVTESKVQELWEETVDLLKALSANLQSPEITELTNTVSRISSLASISDCVSNFEAEIHTRSRSKSKQTPVKVLDVLLDIISTHASSHSEEADVLITAAMKAMLFYYMWKGRSLRTNPHLFSDNDNIPTYTDFSTLLLKVIKVRRKTDDVRISAMGTLLDLHTLFATFRHADMPFTTLGHLILEVPAEAMDPILKTFLALEKSYAVKSKRALEKVPVADDPPEEVNAAPQSSDDEAEDDEEDPDDDEAIQSQRKQRKQHEILLAEKRLCELTGKIVLAIVARVFDSSGPHKGELSRRLVRNKQKLGSNFKEVLNFLEDPSTVRGKKAITRAKPAKEAAAGEKEKEKAGKKRNGLDEEHDDEEEVEEGDEEDLRRRELLEVLEDEGMGTGDGEADGGVEDQEEDDRVGDD